MFGLGNGGMDNFRSAEIVSESNKFDATQYSFFGEPSVGDHSLQQGGLEELDGEALEEDGFDVDVQAEQVDAAAGLYHLAPPRVDDEDDEDLSLAAIFAAQAALQESPSATEPHHPFLLGNDVISTPARARRPSSPSLRLTPGAPSSARQEDSSPLVLRRAPDLSMLEAAQLQQASAYTPPPSSNPNPMQLMHMYPPHGPPAAPMSAGRLVGPTSAADLEAQMLAQAQSQTPGPRPWLEQQLMHDPLSFRAEGMHSMQQQQQQHAPPPWQHLDAVSPGPGLLQQQQQQQYEHGLPLNSPVQRLPGRGVLSPFPGVMPEQELGAQGLPRPPPFPQHDPRSFPMTPPPPPHPSFYGTPPPPPPSMLHPPAPSSAPPAMYQQPVPAHGQPPWYDMSPGMQPPHSHHHHQQQQQQQQQRGPPFPIRPQQMQLLRQPGQSPQHQHQQQQRGGHQGPGHQGSGRPHRGGSLMSEDEVEHIMRIMYTAVHAGHPYAEDYYFQAFTNLHCRGRNDASFEPQALRDLAEGVAALAAAAPAKFVPIEGLGKLVYLNLRTPRMLLDFGGRGDAAEGGEDGPAGRPARPLDQEPLLAARIMIEDCINLLLDVDDIDRRFRADAARAGAAAGPTPPLADAAGLLQRRALLLAGIVSSFRLPSSASGAAPEPAVPPPAGPEHKLSDQVFRRIMALPKGRKLLARTLLVISPPLPRSSPAAALGLPNLAPLHLLWAALRNVGWIFGSSLSGLEVSAERGLAEATAKVAAAAVVAVRGLGKRAELVGCLEALGAGLYQGGGGAAPGCLPLIRTRRLPDEAVGSEWLGDVVAALMQRAEQLGLGAGGGGAAADGGAGGEQQQWLGLMPRVVDAVAGHLQALGAVHAAASAAGSAEALAMVAALAAQPMVAAVSQLASEEGRIRLRTLAQALGA